MMINQGKIMQQEQVTSNQGEGSIKIKPSQVLG